MPYREPSPPPVVHVPWWRAVVRALRSAAAAVWSRAVGEVWPAMFAIVALGGSIIGGIAALAVNAAHREDHERCARLGAVIGVPVVVESGPYHCIGTDPETGRVEAFSVDLLERRVVVEGQASDALPGQPAGPSSRTEAP